MLKGIDINEKIEFVSESDKGDNPTVFLLGNISNRDKLKLFSGAIDAKTGQIDLAKIQDKTLDILQAGLKGIKNLGGKDISEITADVVDLIPFNVAIEIVGKILEFNFASEGETKN